MCDLNYEIFSGDTLVAVWNDHQLSVKDESLLPLFLKRVHDADLWLETRAIDHHRANSRLLKKALRITNKDDLSAVLFANGATITDNYWVRAVGTELSYADVQFDGDYFSKLALRGDYDSFNRAAGSKGTKTPELTNIGSFEKCWKLRDGKWQMWKQANHNEQFSELFISRLGLALGMNMAVYTRGDGIVKTWDFTEGKVNFEPANAFMGDNEDYADVLQALQTLCPAAIPDYIRMIFMDTIVANPDRHTGNFGLLRDKQTGQCTGLAPNFDNNMALISRGYPKVPKSADVLIQLFREIIDAHPEYKEYLPKVTEEIVRKVIADLGMKVKTQTVIDFVMARYELTIKNE